MNRAEYHEYLKSEAWTIRRRWKLEQADFRCQVCNSDGELHVHHRTYERLGRERENDLTALCADCHALFHRKVGEPTNECLEVMTAWRQALSDLWDEMEAKITLGAHSKVDYNPRTSSLFWAMSPAEVEWFIANEDGLRSRFIARMRELAPGCEFQIVPVIAPLEDRHL